MKLYQQLVLFVLAATSVPAVVGLLVLRHNEGQLEQRLLASRRNTAERMAEMISRDVMETVERVQAALGYVRIEEMTPEELTGLLGILYKQSESIIQVAMVDHLGRPVVPGVFLDKPEDYPEYAGRLGVDASAHDAFLKDLPLARALSTGPGNVVLDRPRLTGAGPDIAFAALFPVRKLAEPGPWIAVVDMSMRRIAERIDESSSASGWALSLIDDQGREIVGPDNEPLEDLSARPSARRLAGGQESGAFWDGGTLHAFAEVEPLGWGVLLTQSSADALSEVQRARRITLLATGASILALLLLGLAFTRRITKKLSRFVAGAKAFSAGDLDARVTLDSADELGLLASTFNRMGEDLKASRAEIEAWTQELAERVEKRTRELEVAHRRLLETSKLAAIGQLGAGVAHEVNNPLVGILGNVQLLLLKYSDDDKNRKALLKIEKSAKRCRDVIQTLLRFSEQEGDPDHLLCDLNQIIADAHSLTAERLTEGGIEVVWDLADDLPQVLAAGRQLMQVFLNLFNNARVAMADGGGQLKVSSRRGDDDCLEVVVADQGKGIEAENLQRIFEPFFTTKDVWTNTGMGLSVAFRIVSDHGGRIEVQSEPGRGSVFTVILPTPDGPGGTE